MAKTVYARWRHQDVGGYTPLLVGRWRVGVCHTLLSPEVSMTLV